MFTPEYLKLCQDMHAQRPWGTTGHSYIDEFLPLVRKLRCKTVLDYGCGHETVKRGLGQRASDLEVFGYDPAIAEVSALPDPADFVVCTDVMEHVEEQYVADVIGHIHSLAIRGVYFSIGLVPAKRSLPDGTNAHITLMPSSWWIAHVLALPWTMVKVNPGKKSLRLHIKKEK